MEWMLSSLGCLLEFVTMVVCIYMIWHARFRMNWRICLVFVINLVCFTLVNGNAIPFYGIYSVYILLWLYCYYEFKGGLLKTTVHLLGTVLATGIIQVLSAFVLLCIPYEIEHEELHLAVMNGISVIIASIFSALFRKKWGETYLKEKKYFYSIVICAFCMIIMIIDYLYDHKMNVLRNLLIVLALAGIGGYLLWMQTMRDKLEKQNLELEMRSKYENMYQELLEEVRGRQHSYKNQIGAISNAYLIAETLDELVNIQKGYVTELKENSRYDGILIGCNEPILSGFFYYKCLECDEKHIIMDYDIKVDNIDCNVSLYECIEIIGNLIDNACEQIAGYDEKRRKIKLCLHESDNEINLEIGNPAPYMTSNEISKMFKSGYSTKGRNRGLGLSQVKKIVKKHHLELVVSNAAEDEENWIYFILRIRK